MGDNLAIIPLWVTPQDDQSHTDDRHQHPQMEDLGSDLRDTQNGVVQITSENIEAIAAEMQNLTERSSERAKIMKRLRAQKKGKNPQRMKAIPTSKLSLNQTTKMNQV